MSEAYVCTAEDPEPLGGLGVLIAKAWTDVFIGFAAVVVNLFIVCATASGLAVRGRSGGGIRVSSLFVLNLASVDMLAGLMGIHYHSSQVICPLAHYEARHHALCMFKCVSVILPGLLSINSLSAIAFDRYLCIVHSLRYQDLMTTRRACLIIGLVWAVAVACTMSFVLSSKWQPPEMPCVEAELVPQVIMLSVGVPLNTTNLAIIAITHFCIFREVRRSVAHHRSLSGRPREAGVSDHAGAGPRRHSSASVKSARVLLLVVGCYMGAYTPVIIVMLLRGVGVGERRPLEMAFRVGYTFSTLNYIVNPFTYAWKNAPLKADLVALWARLTRRGGRRRGASKEQQRGGF